VCEFGHRRRRCAKFPVSQRDTAYQPQGNALGPVNGIYLAFCPAF
jgi:hypothetical protein